MAVIAGVHINDGRPRAVRGSARIAGPSRFLFAIFLYWTHFQRSLGQQSEELWQFGLHLRDVSAIFVENLLARRGVQLRIILDGCAKRFQVGKTEFLRDLPLFSLYTGDFFQA